ncbi:MAG: OmpH family outer membrane protein [Saprospiraceae bacterium]|nr:OmpH family outer membrane protein [Saprospiraceae bacterium]
MLKISKIILPVVLFFAMCNISIAQKLGHVNSGNILEQMPEVKAADEKLTQFRTQLVAEGDSLYKKLEADYLQYQKDVQAGILTPIQRQTKEAAIQEMQTKLQTKEQQAQTLISQKREEYLGPILKKLEDAIKMVGKENGYQFIFDTSTGATLYALESQDVSDLVKAKLGLK